MTLTSRSRKTNDHTALGKTRVDRIRLIGGRWAPLVLVIRQWSIVNGWVYDEAGGGETKKGITDLVQCLWCDLDLSFYAYGSMMA